MERVTMIRILSYHKVQSSLLLGAIISLILFMSVPFGIAKVDGGAASMQLTGPTQVNPGDTFDVSIKINTGGQAAVSAQADIQFDTSKLQANSVSSDGSNFDVSGPTPLIDNDTGQVRVIRGSFPPHITSGDALLAKVSFTAQGNSTEGSDATISIADTSRVNNTSNEDYLGTTSNLALVIGNEPPEPGDFTPPEISNIEASNFQPTSTTISWTTNEVATGKVDYGVSTSYGSEATSSASGTSHSVNLTGLTADTTYYYRITATDIAGNTQTSEGLSFFTPQSGNNEQPVEKKILATAQDLSIFSTLLTAVDAAGLTATLNGEGPFTLFAPTNDAFEALPDGVLDALLADTDLLAKVLKYHVISGELAASDVVSQSTLSTLLGDTLAVSVNGSSVKLNDVNITTTDVEASNGIIHVLDGVLVPTEVADALNSGDNNQTPNDNNNNTGTGGTGSGSGSGSGTTTNNQGNVVAPVTGAGQVIAIIIALVAGIAAVGLYVYYIRSKGNGNTPPQNQQ